ncbi:MarR family winged helix-turn-helix transcriptional regulator [Mongoliibacter ruber]|uniref:DNA-binding MarR family transcriptional regulator n=1 Tax=Mongoliibacter ruber TaxID=1750599 RepID=A0A2T0WSW9_9BACT|nr:MarR family transcriptional regulator [Mongoliibacter ruber]PRY89654.1 DNA-binding MarR family transcriptional regulator [Mongoliibacter ruber]
MPNLSEDPSFPFYVASRLFSQVYRAPLEELGLTYPQYLVMLVLWEKDGQMVSQIGQKLQLDSGTLTPLLKRLEAINLIKRVRSEVDERRVEIELTYPGKSLQNKAEGINEKVEGIFNNWEDKEFETLKSLMDRLISEF